MQKTLTKTLILAVLLVAALGVNYLFAAWTGPTQAPTGGNTSTPVHIGSTDQVKDGGLSLNGLSVFGGGYFQGNVGVGVVTPSEALEVDGVISIKEQSSSPSPKSEYGKIYAQPISNTVSTADSNTKLLLHMDGSNNSTNFVDSSNSSHSVSANGNAKIVTSPSKFSQSADFGGNGDYLSIPDSSDWRLGDGSGDFTIDFWVYFDNSSRMNGLAGQWISSNDLWHIEHEGGGNTLNILIISGDNQLLNLSTPFIPSIDTWYHIAYVRNGTDTDNTKIYINGVKQTTTLNLGSWNYSVPNFSAPLTVGAHTNGSIALAGNIDEFRISDTVRWASNFTPPTTPNATTLSVDGLYYMDDNGNTYSLIGGGDSDVSFDWTDITSNTNPWDTQCEYKVEIISGCGTNTGVMVHMTGIGQDNGQYVIASPDGGHFMYVHYSNKGINVPAGSDPYCGSVPVKTYERC